LRSRLNLRGKSVLVVEDDDGCRAALCALIQAFGVTVREARNGYEAWERVRQAKPDLIFCDLQMPGMDGFELIKRLRADRDLCLVRVIAVTGLGSDASFARTLATGFDGHLVKPVNGEILGAQLQRAFPDTGLVPVGRGAADGGSAVGSLPRVRSRRRGDRGPGA
jgi:CheY-like chemotaxis protein